jgi:hypothetical protein
MDVPNAGNAGAIACHSSRFDPCGAPMAVQIADAFCRTPGFLLILIELFVDRV